MEKIKIKNVGNTYKNRHAEVHKRKVGRPKIEFSYDVSKTNRYASPEEILKDLAPVRRVDEETGEVIDL